MSASSSSWSSALGEEGAEIDVVGLEDDDADDDRLLLGLLVEEEEESTSELSIDRGASGCRNNRSTTSSESTLRRKVCRTLLLLLFITLHIPIVPESQKILTLAKEEAVFDVAFKPTKKEITFSFFLFLEVLLFEGISLQPGIDFARSRIAEALSLAFDMIFLVCFCCGLG